MLKDKLLHVVAVIGLWLSAAECWAAANVVFVLSAEQDIYQQLVELTHAALPADLPIHTVRAGARTGTEKFFSADTIVVTIGTEAAEHSYRRLQSPIISALLSESAFAELRPDDVAAARITPLLLDQPIEHYLQLGRALVPRAQSVGVLLGPLQQQYRERIRAAATALNLAVQFAEISAQSNPIKVIDPVLSATDFFVVLADHQAINQAAAKWVLQLSYRHRKPVIAYSKKYAQAGALAALYSAPEDIALQIAAAVTRQLQTPDAPPPAPVFSIEINANVARSLGISVKSIESYRQQILNNLSKGETP